MTDLLLIFLIWPFFCLFTTYRGSCRMSSASATSIADLCWKALVLAKVILLGRYVRFAKIHDYWPLIFPPCTRWLYLVFLPWSLKFLSISSEDLFMEKTWRVSSGKSSTQAGMNSLPGL